MRARRQGVDPKQMAIWTAVSVVAAIGWGMIALARGERISAIWLVAAAVGSYAIGYRFYARFIANRVLGVDDTRATPAERLDNGIDFVPTDRPGFRSCQRVESARIGGLSWANGCRPGDMACH